MLRPTVLNVAAYRFVRLQGLAQLKDLLFERAQAAGLKGTLLLAPEGFNGFLAGKPSSVRDFLEGTLRAHPDLSDLRVSESWSDEVPFQRLRVKIKREIIRMDDEATQPVDGRAPSVAPVDLARWLAQGRDDSGRPVVMLDTRNAFEVDAGRFVGALDWRLARFSEFPSALARHAQSLQGKTIVSYCTGGIRCEKAALLMQRQGLRAFQLDGGILGYFGQVGSAHFNGHCVVFDTRGAVTPSLEPQHAAEGTPPPAQTESLLSA